MDLPEMQALRRSLLPADGCLVTGSALDLAWADAVPDVGPVLITAEGLLMYFTEADALGLIAWLGARRPAFWALDFAAS